MGEKRDKAIKVLRDQITGKQWDESVPGEKPNFWDTSGFKICGVNVYVVISGCLQKMSSCVLI